MLDTFVEQYLVNPKKVTSPQMTIAFQTTELGRKHLFAGVHPADGTARAQILSHEHNPSLYSFIEEYARMTGMGGLLNTSFNTHGYPIVRTSEDAYDVLKTTELDGLWLDGALIMKNQNA